MAMGSDPWGAVIKPVPEGDGLETVMAQACKTQAAVAVGSLPSSSAEASASAFVNSEPTTSSYSSSVLSLTFHLSPYSLLSFFQGPPYDIN
jgi:hypothetical protein